MLTTTDDFDKAMANQSIGHSTVAVNGILYGAKMVLFTNDLVINKATKLADVTQPTYPGYASQTVTWSAVKRDGQGNMSVDSGLMAWQMSDATTPTTVNGYCLLDSTGATVYGAEAFESPVPLVDALSYLGTVVDFNFNNQESGGVTVVT